MKLSSTALVATISLLFAAPLQAQIPAAPTVGIEPASGAARVELSAPDGRKIALSVWTAADERAVIVFSHGYNGNPAAYERIVAAWVEDGFTVVAPLHVDSLRHPDHAAHDGRSAFATRIADLAVARGYVAAAHPRKPMVAAGHSFGSLMSLMAGGAVTVAGPQGDPQVKAVVALSSAGDLQGVVLPDTYAALTAPTLMITGDADLVPGFVSDWTAHRSPFDRSPAGDKMLLIKAGGDHALVRNASADDFSLMVAMTTDFIEAHALGDPQARARLDALKAPTGMTIERR